MSDHVGIANSSHDCQNAYYDYCHKSYDTVEIDSTNNKLIYKKPPVITDFKALYDEVTLEVGDEIKRNGNPYFHYFIEPVATASCFKVDIVGDANVIVRDGFKYKALKPGTITFTVTALNGNKTISFKVNVVEKAKEVAINEETFPDKAFRDYILSDKIDSDKNGSLSRKEIENVQYISVSNKNIKNLKGIEIFYNLNGIYGNDNCLNELDISKNQLLQTVHVALNDLKEIDISKNYMLDSLSCEGCGLEKIITGKNNRLHFKQLYCPSNCLKTLDLSYLSALEYLNCSRNYLKNIDTSKNAILSESYTGNQYEIPVTAFKTVHRKNCFKTRGKV